MTVTFSNVLKPLLTSTEILLRVIKITDKSAHIGIMHLEVNGIIGFHQAIVPQLLLIVNWEGWVRGNRETKFHVKAGDAVFWEKDEWHETTTEKRLTAI